MQRIHSYFKSSELLFCGMFFDSKLLVRLNYADFVKIILVDDSLVSCVRKLFQSWFLEFASCCKQESIDSVPTYRVEASA